MKQFFFGICGLVLAFQIQAQNPVGNRQKGDFFFYWGYNRALYTPSDIRFDGPGYDFTLEKVVAYDRPTPFSFPVYVKPASLTIPQYNVRIGYFFNDNWNLSIGTDHMKYVMPQYQTVNIAGEINQSGNPYNGTYEAGSTISLTPEFLTFEHTDGLNYVNVDFDYFLDLYNTESGKFGVTSFTGGGLGVMVPKSNVKLMSGVRNDQFHVAGYGAHVNVGVQFSFWRYFFIRTQAKGGFIHMFDILTRPGDVEDRAHQKLGFAMWDIAMGWQWRF